MTDRELLELAAKAAGYEYRWDRAVGIARARPVGSGPAFPAWTPLTDDGDALRLAVTLGIDVQQFTESRMVEAWKHPNQACGEDYGSDPFAATRRAITRAAAQIGNAKPADAGGNTHGKEAA